MLSETFLSHLTLLPGQCGLHDKIVLVDDVSFSLARVTVVFDAWYIVYIYLSYLQLPLPGTSVYMMDDKIVFVDDLLFSCKRDSMRGLLYVFICY